MKNKLKNTLLSLLFVGMSMISNAAPPVVKVAWDDPGAAETAIIGGYRIHLGEVSGAYTETRDIGNPEDFKAQIFNLQVGKIYFCALTAYGTELAGSLESDYSNEISFKVTQKPDKPAGLKVDVIIKVGGSTP